MGGELLLEVGVEEVPSQDLPKTLLQLASVSSRLLRQNRLSYDAISPMVTPRRLVLSIQGLAEWQDEAIREIQGPPINRGFDSDGHPTQAAEKFARAQGVTLKSLQVKKTSRGEYLVAQVREKRRKATGLLREMLPQMLDALTFPRTMRWNAGGTRFVRPIRWILALYEKRTVSFRYAELKSGNRSYGHALMSPGSFILRDAGAYLKELKKRRVIVDHVLRREMIREQVQTLTRSARARLREDPEILDQSTFQVEFPVAIRGRFDRDFLGLPEEVLVNVMREQQGYFTLYSRNGKILPEFICITNVKVSSMKTICAGHERVLKARLEDARFYFEEDQKIPLEGRVEGLRGMVFQDRLGTLYDKVQRLDHLTRTLADGLDLSCQKELQRAVWLCKADLLTGMVREFPSLQGVMGREYARLQGESEDVSRAIFEHHLPRSAQDPMMPKTAVSKCLAVADKLDTLCGCFAVGLRPSGSEDPYGLRRMGQGIIRILLDDVFIRLSLGELIRTSLSLFPQAGLSDPSKCVEDVRVFLRERMQSFLRTRATTAGQKEVSLWFKGTTYRADLVDAVLSQRFDRVAEAYRRIVALVIFHRQSDFEPLMVAYKRAARIVPAEWSRPVQSNLFREPEEKALSAACQKAELQIRSLLRDHHNEDVLRTLAGLRQPIDAFFDKVFVMVEDQAIRENRLALLKMVCDLFNQYGDFSRVMVEERTPETKIATGQSGMK